MRRALAPRRGAPCGKWAADDPRRWRSAAMTRFFTAAMQRKMRREFAAVRRSGIDIAAHRAKWHGRPVVLYCNHPSWWDPAYLGVLVAGLLADRVAYAPIDAQALERYPFMRRCGLFGIQPHSNAGALKFLDIGARLLARPDTVLCVTPQGAFVDARTRPLRLMRGLAVLLSRMPDAVVVPVALEYVFWDESRPEALSRIGEPVGVPAHEPASVQAWQRALTEELARTMDALAADSAARDARRFTTVAEGRAGVGGVYDGWRRAQAWFSGRRFDPHHGLPAQGPQP